MDKMVTSRSTIYNVKYDCIFLKWSLLVKNMFKMIVITLMNYYWKQLWSNNFFLFFLFVRNKKYSFDKSYFFLSFSHTFGAFIFIHPQDRKRERGFSLSLKLRVFLLLFRSLTLPCHPLLAIFVSFGQVSPLLSLPRVGRNTWLCVHT